MADFKPSFRIRIMSGVSRHWQHCILSSEGESPRIYFIDDEESKIATTSVIVDG